MNSQFDQRIRDYWTIRAMEVWGGGFVRALSLAASRADDDNLMRLKHAFPLYFKQYEPMGMRLEEKNPNEEVSRVPDRLDSANHFSVCRDGDELLFQPTVGVNSFRCTPGMAINLAAWLVVVADREQSFKRLLEEIRR